MCSSPSGPGDALLFSGPPDPAESAICVEAGRQASYHRGLFAALYSWDTVWETALDLAGDAVTARRLALDQLGHFGPLGVELVADRLIANAERPLGRVVELGSGFGGALRHMEQVLASHGARPFLIGVELVAEHCALAALIGRAIGGSAVGIVQADARRLPFPSASVDAVFAAGSASHFSSMSSVLKESSRVLRPGGVLVMTEEVSLRPFGAPNLSAFFLRHHPRDVFAAASPEERRAELNAARLHIEAFQSLHDWAMALLQQRVRALRLLGICAARIFGADAQEFILRTLESAADEYARGAIEPYLIVARRPR